MHFITNTYIAKKTNKKTLTINLAWLFFVVAYFSIYFLHVLANDFQSIMSKLTSTIFKM